MKIDKRYIRVILYLILNKKCNINYSSCFVYDEIDIDTPINISSPNKHLSTSLLNLCGLTELRHYSATYCPRVFHILKFTELPKERECMVANIYRKEVSITSLTSSKLMLGYDLYFFGLKSLHE